MNDIEHIINHIRNRTYMSGVERNRARIKSTGEVFTPTLLVQEILDTFDQLVFSDSTKTVLDPACGDGQFLGEALIRKLEAVALDGKVNEKQFEQALSTIYGVDLMIDNVDLCRERLLCGQEQFRHIVEQNIYQADALKFSYEFKPMSATRRNREYKLRKKVMKDTEKAKNEAVFETSKAKSKKK